MVVFIVMLLVLVVFLAAMLFGSYKGWADDQRTIEKLRTERDKSWHWAQSLAKRCDELEEKLAGTNKTLADTQLSLECACEEVTNADARAMQRIRDALLQLSGDGSEIKAAVDERYASDAEFRAKYDAAKNEAIEGAKASL